MICNKLNSAASCDTFIFVYNFFNFFSTSKSIASGTRSFKSPPKCANSFIEEDLKYKCLISFGGISILVQSFSFIGDVLKDKKS